MTIAADVQRHMEDSSWIRRMFELGIALKRERGDDNVFDLSLGNPVAEPPPQFFRRAAPLRRVARAGRAPLYAQCRLRRDPPGRRRRALRRNGTRL